MVKRISRSKRRKSKQRRSRRKVSKKRSSRRRSRRKVSKRNSKGRSRRKVSKRNSKRRISKQKQDGGEVKYGDPTVGDKIGSVFRAAAVPLNTVKDTAGRIIERAERGFRDNKYDMEARFSEKLGDLKTKITPKKGTAEITRAKAQYNFDKCKKNIKFSDNDKKTRDKLRELRKAGKNISPENEKLLDILNWGTITTGPLEGNVRIHPCDMPEIPCADNNRCVQNEYQSKQCVSDESIKKCDKRGLKLTSKGAIHLGSEKMFPNRK